MTDAPEKIWARVKATSYTIGTNREVGELRDWCEGYATPEIAQTCGSTEYTRSDIAQARIDTLEAELSWYGEQARMSAVRRIWHPRALFRRGHCQLQALSMDGGKRARAVLKGTDT